MYTSVAETPSVLVLALLPAFVVSPVEESASHSLWIVIGSMSCEEISSPNTAVVYVLALCVARIRSLGTGCYTATLILGTVVAAFDWLLVPNKLLVNSTHEKI